MDGGWCAHDIRNSGIHPSYRDACCAPSRQASRCGLALGMASPTEPKKRERLERGQGDSLFSCGSWG